MAAITDIDLRFRVQESSAKDLGVAVIDHLLEKNYDWTSGTTADKADLVWSDSRSLAATSEDLDLAGSLSGALGGTVTFARIKMIVIENTHASATLAVGGASSNQFVNWVANSSDIVNVPPGGIFVLGGPKATGFAVTPGTGDLLKLDSGASTITYKILLIGASA